MNRLWIAVAALGSLGAAGLAWYGTASNALDKPLIDHKNLELVALGEQVYNAQCAACHGVELQGQPNWREQLPTGGLPAPPHDESGHTWHHEDQVLFDYTKLGGQALVGQSFKSNMPGFGEVLSDLEIRAVLSFIKSNWPARVQDMHDQRNAAAEANQ